MVSEDGITWYPVPGSDFNNPTPIYTDVDGPYTSDTGSNLANFAQPFTDNLSSFDNEDFAGTLGVLNGSAGGTWLDLSSTGLSEVNYVGNVPDRRWANDVHRFRRRHSSPRASHDWFARSPNSRMEAEPPLMQSEEMKPRLDANGHDEEKFIRVHSCPFVVHSLKAFTFSRITRRHWHHRLADSHLAASPLQRGNRPKPCNV